MFRPANSNFAFGISDMEAGMNRDELNRELRAHSASWQAVVIVYALIVGTMVLSAMAIL